MQCRQPSLEGTGEVGLRRLIKEALRMRPDRLVVGEVREAEALDLLIALNSGLPGMCSIHANSARDALSKLCTLPLLAGRNIDSDFVVPTVAGSIDIVVHCELERDGTRRVVEIIAPSGQNTGSTIEASSIFALQRGTIQRGTLESTGGYPSKTAKFGPCRARSGNRVGRRCERERGIGTHPRSRAAAGGRPRSCGRWSTRAVTSPRT